MAALMVTAAMLIWTLPRIREKPLRIRQAPQLSMTRWDKKDTGYGIVFRHPYFLRTMLLGLINYGGFTAIQTLWIGPWMTTVLGHPPSAAARILFWFNLTLLGGFIFNGWLAPRLDRRGIPLVLYVMALIAMGIAAQALIVGLGPRGSWRLWVFYALAATGYILYQCTIGPAFPAVRAGRANTAHNLAHSSGSGL